MLENWIIIGGSLMAGLSTALGAVPIYFKREFSKDAINIGLGFSAGVMLVASFISLILPGAESASEVYGQHFSLFILLLGIFLGYIFIILLHDLIPHQHLFKKEMHKSESKNLSRVTMIVLAISIHNFPEGLSVGVGFGGGDLSSGLALAIAISIQNMPEGLVVAFGLLSINASKNKAFFMAFLSGMIEPIAAIIGFISAKATAYSLPIALGFAGGAMLFVTCQEIFPELFRKGNEKKVTLGVVAGVAAMLAIDHYL